MKGPSYSTKLKLRDLMRRVVFGGIEGVVLLQERKRERKKLVAVLVGCCCCCSVMEGENLTPSASYPYKREERRAVSELQDRGEEEKGRKKPNKTLPKSCGVLDRVSLFLLHFVCLVITDIHISSSSLPPTHCLSLSLSKWDLFSGFCSDTWETSGTRRLKYL